MSTDFGLDLSCISDLDAGMREVTGTRQLGEALARRLITPRGTLLDDGNYGTDMTQFVDADINRGTEGRIGSLCDAEFAKDERVFSSRTTASLLKGVLTLSSAVVAGAGPFTLVIAVTNVTVAVLQPSS